MLKLFFSTYLVFFIPYITSGKLGEFLINSGFIAEPSGRTELGTALFLLIVLFLGAQLITCALLNKYLFKGKL